MTNTLVFDIGKTHIKLCVLDQSLQLLAARETKNRVVQGEPYPHADTDYIWDWFCTEAKELTQQYPIEAVNITTHGATAACVNTQENCLTLPILDYEFDGLVADEATAKQYQALRDDFALTQSPNLPAGLNLGRQLHWLEQKHAAAFAQADTILLYPQYWFWRLTGERCAEVTSLGCHTDLWQPHAGNFAPLVQKLGWASKLPALKDARHWAKPEAAICAITGLAADCKIYAGIHDSNASFWRHKAFADSKPFTVISTGTWSIVMASGTSVNRLIESQDMLANVDVTGAPVACARFMGGREYEAICKLTGAPLAQNSQPQELNQRVDAILSNATFALPAFAEAGGPFSGRRGRIVGELNTGSGNCLASIYCALMLDHLLDALDSQGHIIIEGAFLKNALLCGLLAQLRPTQPILLSNDDTGTVTGCALLTREASTLQAQLSQCQATAFAGLDQYKNQWRLAVQKMNQVQL